MRQQKGGDMHKESKQGEANFGQSLSSENPSDQPNPKELARLFLQQVAALPWVGFGAIGTGIGVALLYFYFESIDFVPADIPSILSASLLVAMLAFAFYMWVVASLIAPLWSYRHSKLQFATHVIDKSTGLSDALALPSLQFLGVGSLLLLAGVGLWLKCSSLADVLLMVGVGLALLGALGWAWSEYMAAGWRASWLGRLPAVAWVCFSSALPVSVLLVFLVPSQGAEWWHLGVVVVLWLGVVLGSIFLDRIPVWGAAFVVTAMSPFITFLVPALLGLPFLFPIKVAELTGIRTEHPIELRVPKSTCDLIQSALDSRPGGRSVNCVGGDWNKVHAQVLSNLGDRWLIELQPDGASLGGGKVPLRLTIPGDGVQRVSQIATPPASCRF
jgi:hypothetical protein